MALTDKLSVVGQGVKAVIDTHQVALGIQAVYYGDQLTIPKVPTIAIETDSLERELGGIGGKGQTNNIFLVYLICYLAKISQSEQVTRLAIEQLTEAIIDRLHLDVTLGGLVTHGFCDRVESGYATRQNVEFKVVRIRWQGKNKTAIA